MWRDSSDAGQAFLRRWCAVMGAGALVVSLVDAVLLQRRIGYFTGGFLSDDHLRGAADYIAFAAVSVLADAAVVGLVAAFVLWLAPRLDLSAPAAVFAAALASLTPLFVTNVVSYQLLAYLGDALDISLAYELAGGSVGEMWAVASSHVMAPLAAIAALSGAGGGAVWLVNRYASRPRLRQARGAIFVLPVLLAFSGLVATVVASTTSERLDSGIRRKPSGKVLGFLAETLTDFDRDGFSMTGRLVDPAPFDAHVYPFAIDIPGNGIDENGIGGDLPAGEGPNTAVSETQPWTSRRDVLLFVLESFRADLLGASLGGRPITPVMSELASRGMTTARAYSPNGYTSQSRFHLFSGSIAGTRRGTLVDDFKANGYTVGYFSGQDESFGGPRYDVGFSRADVAYDARADRSLRYSTSTTPGSLAVPMQVVQARISEFLAASTRAAQPLFMYVNFHDTHFPYTHDQIDSIVSDERLPRQQIGPGAREALWQTYANTAANVDRAIGQVIDMVRTARGTEPAIIITADHGESLFDDEFLGHGHALNEVQTRVPFIAVNLPLQIVEPLSHVDLRDAIGRAMSGGSSTAGAVRPDPDRVVFQYLGTIERPRQIAFLRDSTRTIYDFRTRQVQIRGGRPKRVDDMSDAERDQFQELVWYWERMRLLQSGMNDDS